MQEVREVIASDRMDQDDFGVTEIWNYKNVEAVQLAVVQKLRKEGLAVPRGQGSEHQLGQRHRGNSKSLKSVFRQELSNHPSSPYQYGCHTFHLPRIFVLLVENLEKQVCTKGLFRKAGSVSRQRTLKVYSGDYADARRASNSSIQQTHDSCSAGLENSTPFLPADTNPHDLAGLLKQFLRQLPSYLLAAHLSGLLEACVTLVPAREQTQNLLLVCLLLPPLHLQCLCVLMRLLALVADGAAHSFMDASNLAIVMAPSLMEMQGSNILDIHSNPLKRQTTIVRLLIENASMLGCVPHGVGVVAEHLESKLKMTKAASLDDLDNDTLPDKEDCQNVKQRTSTLSGLVIGLGNKLRRQKRSGSADFHLLNPKKRTKTCEHLLEQDKLSPQSETSTSARGNLFSPLLRTSHKYNFSHPRSIKFPFPPWRSSASNSPDITSPCLLRSLSTSSPSSLLHNDIHPSTITSQLNSESAIVTSSNPTSATFLARESSLEISPATNPQDAGMAEEESVVLEEEGGVAFDTRAPAYLRCANKVGGIRTDSYQEAIMSGCVSGTNVPSSPCLPVLCEGRKMEEEQQQEENGVCGIDGSHYAYPSHDSGNDSSLHSETKVGCKHHNYGNAHYSATLGITMLDLPRRTLRDHKHKGTPNVFSFKPASAPIGGQKWMNRDQWGKEEDVDVLHCSPASLSACLGISSLKPNSRAAGLRRMHCRNRMRQKYCSLRANLQENRSAVHTQDSCLKSCASDVKSCDFGSPLLPPPLYMVGGSSGDLGSGVAVGNGLGSVRDGLPQQSLWFNSSWGRQAERSRLDYTLVKDRGNLSRHTLPYTVDGPGGPPARGVEHMAELPASAPLHANFHCPLKRASNTNVAVEKHIL